MAFIGIDWGSTHCRASLISEDGHIKAESQSGDGVLQNHNIDFPGIISTLCQPWLKDPALPILICGMAGSQNGWLNTGYCEAPVDVHKFSSHIQSVNSPLPNPVYLFPGICNPSDQSANVLRGEETQLFGAVLEKPDGVFCLPGTHSKWVNVKKRTVDGFHTFMTGELFALLTQHGSLAFCSPDSPFDSDFFQLGLKQSQSENGLSSQLFETRARFALQQHSAGQSQHYLSGLLIGHEFRYGSSHYGLTTPLTMIASPALQTAYSQAGAYWGREIILLDPAQCTARGMTAIAQTHGLFS